MNRFHVWKKVLILCVIVQVLCILPNQLFALQKNGGDNQFIEKSFPMGKEENNDTILLASLRISKDSSHLAYAAKNKKSGKYIIIADGNKSREWDEIGRGTPAFSTITNRLAYIGYMADKQYLVVDGKEVAVFDKILGFQFSPNGRHWTCQAVNGNKRYMVVDGKTSRGVGVIGEYVFSPDSKHFAYTACAQGKCRVIVNGKKLRGFKGVMSPHFSPDSRHFSYVAGWQGDMFIILDSRRLKYGGDIIGTTNFSPDSSRFVYALKKDKKWYLVIDGEKSKAIKNPLNFKFSLDSKHYVYVKGDRGRQVVVYDGIAGKEFDAVSDPFFSLDSKHYSYIGKKGNTYFMVKDDEVMNSYSTIYAPPVFSYDSRNLYYRVGLDNNKMALVMDSKEGKIYDGIEYLTSISEKIPLAYFAQKGKEQFLVIDGKEGKHYKKVEKLTFNPDGGHFAYVALKNEKWIIVIDDHECQKTFDENIKSAKIVFSPDGKLNYIGIKVNNNGMRAFYRFEVEIRG